MRLRASMMSAGIRVWNIKLRGWWVLQNTDVCVFGKRKMGVRGICHRSINLNEVLVGCAARVGRQAECALWCSLQRAPRLHVTLGRNTG